VLATIVLTGMQRYTEIDPESGFATAFESVGLPAVANVVAVGAIVSVVTVMLTFMLGASRVWFSMSRDGLLPAWFAVTDRKRNVPTRVTWIIGVGSALFAGFLPITVVAELTNIGILLAFVVVCAAVIVLRYRRPEIPRTFRLPLMPVVPIVGIAFSLWLVSSLPWETWVRFGVWLVIGLVIYLTYSRRNSVLAADSPRNRR
jgi:APA family basic amino acid/polyamine antiporter